MSFQNHLVPKLNPLYYRVAVSLLLDTLSVSLIKTGFHILMRSKESKAMGEGVMK